MSRLIFLTSLLFLAGLTACTDTVSQSGGLAIGRVDMFQQAIDQDGDVIAYTSREGQLYIRDYSVSSDAQAVCRSYSGGAPNGVCAGPQLSADGNLVVFDSDADNLVENDGNGAWDIFLLDRSSGTIERITKLEDGTEFNGSSLYSSIDDSGRFIAFWTGAKNLPGPPPEESAIDSVAIFDRETGKFIVASVAANGSVRREGYAPHLSADGSKLVYSSPDVGIVDGIEEGETWHVYQFDIASRTNRLVSIAFTGEPLRNSDSYAPRTNGDGSKVVFYSEASSISGEYLVDDPSMGVLCPPPQVYIRDMVAGVNKRVTVDPSGECLFTGGPRVVPVPNKYWQGIFPAPDIDHAGRNVVFGGNDLLALDNPDVSSQPAQAYLRDMVTGKTELVSYGTQSRGGVLVQLIADDIAHFPRISGDGNRIIYHSLATNLTPNDFQITPLWDVFRLTRDALGP